VYLEATHLQLYIEKIILLVTNSFLLPSNLFAKFLGIFSSKNKAKNSTKHIYMLVRSCRWGIIGKYQDKTSKWSEKP